VIRNGWARPIRATLFHYCISRKKPTWLNEYKLFSAKLSTERERRNAQLYFLTPISRQGWCHKIWKSAQFSRKRVRSIQLILNSNFEMGRGQVVTVPSPPIFCLYLSEGESTKLEICDTIQPKTRIIWWPYFSFEFRNSRGGGTFFTELVSSKSILIFSFLFCINSGLCAPNRYD